MGSGCGMGGKEVSDDKKHNEIELKFKHFYKL